MKNRTPKPLLFKRNGCYQYSYITEHKTAPLQREWLLEICSQLRAEHKTAPLQREWLLEICSQLRAEPKTAPL